jgi:hypothetical protein
MIQALFEIKGILTIAFVLVLTTQGRNEGRCTFICMMCVLVEGELGKQRKDVREKRSFDAFRKNSLLTYHDDSEEDRKNNVLLVGVKGKIMTCLHTNHKNN